MSSDAQPLQQAHSLRESIALYRDRRLFIIFVLGISSGFPWVLIASSMTAWLQEAGLTRTSIGFFGSIFAVYSVNFLWAPLVDRIKLPLLNKLGQRRSWILLMQSVMLLATLGIAFTDPSISLLWTSLLALLIALASATQDIAIDAYRIDTISRDEAAKIPHGSAMATSGWWTGFKLPGALALILADLEGWSWGEVYLVLAGIVLVLMIFVSLIKEPQTEREQNQAAADASYQRLFFGEQSISPMQRSLAWLASTIIEPFKEFFTRNGVKLALAILLFVFLFKIGEAFLGRMAIVFYKEIGFSNTEIGLYSKIVGWWVTIIFSIVASLICARFGLIRGLLIGGLAMAATNLLFSLMALIGPDVRVFAFAVIADDFTSAFATVAFVAFISYLTSRTYTATQYALLASLGTVGRTLLAGLSGLMVDSMDGNWALFFVLTALMVLPSLLLLLWIGQLLKPMMAKQAS